MVKRGDVIVAAFGGGLGNKPRPAIVVQDDLFDAPFTILAIPMTSDLETVSIIRPALEPTPANGLSRRSCLMTDKLFPVRRSLIGGQVGTLSESDMSQVERAMQLILGMVRG